MKKLIFFFSLIFSVGAIAQEQVSTSIPTTPKPIDIKESDENPKAVSAAASGAVQIENDGFRKSGTSLFPLRIYHGTATAPAQRFYDNGFMESRSTAGEIFGWGINASGQIEFISNGTTTFGTSNTAMTIDDDTRNIGIGTTSPSAKLEVTGEANTEVRISTNLAGFGSSRLGFYSDKGTVNEWRPGYVASGDNGSFTGRLDFYTNGTSFANATGSVLGMSVANGRVGVGSATATDPKFPLHVTSSAVSVSSTTGSFGIGSLTGLHLTFDTDEIQAWNNTTGSNFYFNQDSKGDVIIGGGGQGGLVVNGFAKLGSSSPKIKMLKFSGTTAVASSTNIAHGLTASKIISVNATINSGAFYYAPGSTYSAGFQYDLVWNATNIQLDNVGTSLQGDPYTVTVIYEE